MTTRVLDVPDISCDHCRMAITAAVEPLAGVSQVKVDLEARTVEVHGGDMAEIVSAVAGAGYEVAGVR